MADSRALEEAVRTWARRLHDEAIQVLCDELDIRVPDSGQVHAEKLRTTRVLSSNEYGPTFTTTITYTAETAAHTEFGTTEHRIDAHRPPWALHFYWPQMGGFVFFDHVNWKPGPGVAKNMGWFSGTIEQWPEAVRTAQDRLG